MSMQISGKLSGKQLKNNPENNFQTKQRLAQEKLFKLFLISWRAFWIFYEYSTFTQFPLDVCFINVPRNLWILNNSAPNVAPDQRKSNTFHRWNSGQTYYSRLNCYPTLCNLSPQSVMCMKVSDKSYFVSFGHSGHPVGGELFLPTETNKRSPDNVNSLVFS